MSASESQPGSRGDQLQITRHASITDSSPPNAAAIEGSAPTFHDSMSLSSKALLHG